MLLLPCRFLICSAVAMLPCGISDALGETIPAKPTKLLVCGDDNGAKPLSLLRPIAAVECALIPLFYPKLVCGL